MRANNNLVYTVGVNDADYKVRTKVLVDGEIKSVLCPYYYRWTNMLKRCYGNKGEPLYDCYQGCSVHPDWHSFGNFKAWMEKQDWKGKQLDKDLRVRGNKVYSEDTCCFVDIYLNSLITKSRGKINKNNTITPLGVSEAVRGNNVYYMTCMVKRGGHRDSVWGKGYGYKGYKRTPMEAHKVWQLSKRDHFIELLNEYNCPLVKQGIQRVIDMLNNDINNNLETKHL